MVGLWPDIPILQHEVMVTKAPTGDTWPAIERVKNPFSTRALPTTQGILFSYL